ncbi:MAG TPA: hypothetical protein VGU01_14610 [Sphingomicrobium sp.]|nr:hypothetical protein [Sphingomicrobium sp.]
MIRMFGLNRHYDSKLTSASTRWQAWMLMGDDRRIYATIEELDKPKGLATFVQNMT